MYLSIVANYVVCPGHLSLLCISVSVIMSAFWNLEKVMRRLILLPLLVVLLLFPVGASAQTPVTIENLQVELWPEYDRPEMLVIYRIELAANTSLPTTVSLPIPAAAGEPNAVAVAAETGGLVMAEYQSQTQGEWTMITVLAESIYIQIEYYDPGLVVDGQSRTFDYTWPGGLTVNNLELEVQQPFDATDIVFSPELASSQVAGDGLIYHSGSFGAVATEQEFSLSVQYEKPSDTLSVTELMAQQPAQQPAEADPGNAVPIDSGSTYSNWLPWALGVAGLGLIGYGLYSYIRGGQSSSKKSRSSKPRKRASAKQKGAGVFCHSCGVKSLGGDKFCRECGVKLRK